MAVEPRVVGVRWWEEVFVLVVGLVPVEDSGRSPVLDGAGVDAQALGHLVDGEHPGGAEAFPAAG